MHNQVTNKFQKDTKKLPLFVAKQLDAFFDFIEESSGMNEVVQHRDCIKLSGYKTMRRLRIGDRRAGFSLEGETLTFLRILHRNEIYKYFP